MKKRTWSAEWVRRICCRCLTSLGRHKKAPGTDARIRSHGLCALCSRELYPEYQEDSHEKNRLHHRNNTEMHRRV